MTRSANENKKVLELPECEDKERAKLLAGMYASPVMNAAVVVMDANPNSALDLTSLMMELKKQANDIQQGETGRIEEMLMLQAYALQSIFSKCASRMMHSDTLLPYKANGTLALKAQNQCRQTLATLAAIKQPKRTTFIKNQATNQQVNFQADSQKKITPSSNELLSEGMHAAMDGGGAEAASGADTNMATVENRRGEDARR